MYMPACHLRSSSLSAQDIVGAEFETIKTYTDDVHATQRLVQCASCGALYLKEFSERVDWVNGDDQQTIILIPVTSEDEANALIARNSLATHTPRLVLSWPASEPHDAVWIE